MTTYRIVAVRHAVSVCRVPSRDPGPPSGSTSHDRELVEVIETAAYLVCGNGRVDSERFALIIGAKGVRERLPPATGAPDLRIIIGSSERFLKRQ